MRTYFLGWLGLLTFVAGCGRGPARIEAPDIDPMAAADRAIELYDTDGDQMLDEKELARCPGIQSMLPAYDQDGNRTVDRDEIAQRLGKLFKNRVGLTQLRSRVLFQGRPLSDAIVILEPEPYLGEQIETAQGITNSHGSAQISIPTEHLPEHVRNMKLVRCGTYKVRITHPTIKLPAKYNTETTLGYETQLGNPFVKFSLTAR